MIGIQAHHFLDAHHWLTVVLKVFRDVFIKAKSLKTVLRTYTYSVFDSDLVTTWPRVIKSLVPVRLWDLPFQTNVS